MQELLRGFAEAGTDASRRRAASWVEASAPRARDAFVASVLSLGVLQIIFGESLARMFPAWPAGLPGRPFWAHAMGALLAIAAAVVLARGRSRGSALALAALMLVPVAGLHLPRAIPSGYAGVAWLSVLKFSAMASGAFVVAARTPAQRAVAWQDLAASRGAAMAPWLLGAFMLLSAYLHVRNAEFVAQLMQPWMPWRLFWTYFAAVTLAAGGIGLVVPRTARLAALLTSLMILSWFFLVHIPRMLADPAGPIGWSEMAESLAFSAMAFLLAARAGRTNT